MKKIISLLLALVMCLSLCACGGGNDTSNAPDTTEAPTTAPTAPPISREALGLEACIDFLKDHLKNPNSLEVLEVRYVLTRTVDIHYEIEYTAENSFGGADRDTIYMTAFVTFPTEKSESSARIDSTFESRTNTWGINDASLNARDSFNKYISDVQTMDEATIQELLG